MQFHVQQFLQILWRYKTYCERGFQLGQTIINNHCLKLSVAKKQCQNQCWLTWRFPKMWGTPSSSISIIYRIFHHKPSILVYPHAYGNLQHVCPHKKAESSSSAESLSSAGKQRTCSTRVARCFHRCSAARLLPWSFSGITNRWKLYESQDGDLMFKSTDR